MGIISKTAQSSVIRYGLTGASAFAADYIVLLTLFNLLKAPLILATTVGYLTGFAISFTTNRKWVFAAEKHRKGATRQLIEYSILVAFNYIFTVAGIEYLNHHGIKPFIGKLFVMAMVMCWNYVLFRWVIFVKHSE